MKKFYLLVVVMAVASFAVSGCVSISKYTPPSKEEERPVLKVGSIGKEQPKVKVEVELLERPDLSRFSAPKTPDNEVTGNRGNFAGGVMTRGMAGEGKLQPVKQEPKVWWSTMPEESVKAMTEAVPQVIEEKPAMKKYKVKKGQTLQDISKEIYGTTKNWKKIYEANKDKLKSPDKIYAGQILNIHQEKPVKHLK